MMTDAEYFRVASTLFAESDGEWRCHVRHVMPQLIGAGELQDLADDGLPRRVCSTARSDVLALASAHSTMIMPRGVNWFALDAGEDPSDNERDWMKAAQQAMQKELETGNFYPEGIAMTIDRVAGGTGALLAEADWERRRLVFTHVPVGSFRIRENENHEVDTLVRKFKFSAHQAAEAFGLEALDEELRRAYDCADRRYSELFELWHLTLPRDVAGRGNASWFSAREAMPFASVYINPRSQRVLKEEGYEEFPYMVTRFLKYGHQVYGESALAPVCDVVEDYIETEEAMKTVAKCAAFPRILATAEQADELDLRAGGITIVKPDAAGQGLPREWASQGRYDAGLRMLEYYKQNIHDALFVSMLQSVSQVDRQMSATEAQLRENEKLMTFSQTFTQYTADFRPLMARVFCLMFRLEKFPPNPPQRLFRTVGPRGDEAQVLAPGVHYVGKLAKALESGKLEGLMRALQAAVQMWQATQDAAWLDYFKPYECTRFLTDESNVPVECLRSTEEAKHEAQRRLEVQEAQLQAQLAVQQSQAARNEAQAQLSTGR